MDHFIVSARKYRPTTFQTVVGQEHITNTLKNAIKNHQLAQSFLFYGPRGVGKTTCARILAKTINCQTISSDTEACGSCPSCCSFQQGGSLNIHELDAASNNSVEDIRCLIDQVRIPPQGGGKYKIYIIDEVHMLSQAAFNAFLKTLEEPPHYAIFILATTEKHKILPTILSRCQIFDFNRITIEPIARHLADIALKDHIAFEPEGLYLIAQKAEGSLRDALSMFDKIVSFSNKNISYQAVLDNLNVLDYEFYFKVTDALLAEDIPTSLLIFDDILTHGFDGNHFVIGLAAHFRNLLVCKDEATLRLLELSEVARSKYQEQSRRVSTDFLIAALELSNQCDINYRTSKHPRLEVELSLIKLCTLSRALLPLAAPLTPVEKKKPEANQGAELKATAQQQLSKQTLGTTPSFTESATASLEKDAPVVISSEQKSLQTSDQPVEDNPKTPAAPAYVRKEPSIVIPSLKNFSLNSITAKEEQAQYLQGNAQQAFTTDSLKALWQQYATKKKKEGKMNIFILMTSNELRLLDNFQIEVSVDNKVQADQLAAEKVDLLNFLRVELQNFKIDLVSKQIDRALKKQLYTAHEKYLHLVEKNPKIAELKEKFNLMIEY